MKLIIVMFIATTLAENGSCPTGDTLCLSCVDTKCQACVFSLETDGKCVEPTTKIGGCVAYASSSVCAACDKGKNNLGTSCPGVTVGNCLSETAGICTSCKDGKTPATDGKSCTDTACSDSNCAICAVLLGFQGCAECKSGYAMDSTGKCVAEVTANCLQ